MNKRVLQVKVGEPLESSLERAARTMELGQGHVACALVDDRINFDRS